MAVESCIVLGIDPGATSGWALMQPPSPGVTRHAGTEGLVMHGTTTSSAKGVQRMRQVIAECIAHAEGAGLPLVVVAESWRGTGGRNRGVRTLTGIGAAWGRWESLLLLEGVPASRIVRLDTGTWCKRAYGVSRKKSAAWKAMAKSYVQRRFGVDLASDDEAEAVVIAHVGIRSPEVRAVLPKRRAG
jgi:hypothetical protein